MIIDVQQLERKRSKESVVSAYFQSVSLTIVQKGPIPTKRMSGLSTETFLRSVKRPEKGQFLATH